MARKRAGKKDMGAAAEPALKPVRLDLDPETHRMLRLVAATEDKSMAAFARETLERVLREEVKRKGLKL
jgi:plasmid stability protein